MILGNVVLPKTKYPPEIVKASRRKDVYVDRLDLPEWVNGATPKDVNPPEWLTCLHAWPHEDTHFALAESHYLFLTIALRACHKIGDMKCYPQDVEPGDVFVVDPLVVHWLAPRWNNKGVGFISLQWTIPRSRAAACVRHIMCALGGKWYSKANIDKRYRRFVSCPIKHTGKNAGASITSAP
jgi:hypothetical protein